MKRLFSLMLVAVMALSLCCCGTKTDGTVDTQKNLGTFAVGFSRVDITPTYSVPITGYGDALKRWSTGAFDNLYCNCVAFADEQNTRALMITLDMGNITESVADTVRKSVADATGVPFNSIILNASHTHSGVEYRESTTSASQRYISDLCKWAARAGKEALADLAPATIQIGTTETENMNFVRRYVMNDGTFAGDNYGTSTSGYKCHESEADPEMQLIRFVRQDKVDVLMANWQCHPHVGSASYGRTEMYYELSPDFVGAFRRSVEEQVEDVVCMYVQGAAGNLNGTSKIAAENANNTDQVEFGSRLASYAVKAVPEMEAVNSGLIKTTYEDREEKCNHTDDALLAQATLVYAYYKEHGSDNTLAEMCATYGLNSQHHASGVINNSKLPETDTIQLTCFGIGDISFAAYPYEMFCQEGQQIKENTPYKMTFISGYSNGFFAYIPDDLGWNNGGYERDITKFVQGTAEDCAQGILDLLNSIHG